MNKKEDNFKTIKMIIIIVIAITIALALFVIIKNISEMNKKVVHEHTEFHELLIKEYFDNNLKCTSNQNSNCVNQENKGIVYIGEQTIEETMYYEYLLIFDGTNYNDATELMCKYIGHEIEDYTKFVNTTLSNIKYVLINTKTKAIEETTEGKLVQTIEQSTSLSELQQKQIEAVLKYIKNEETGTFTYGCNTESTYTIPSGVIKIDAKGFVTVKLSETPAQYYQIDNSFLVEEIMAYGD